MAREHEMRLWHDDKWLGYINVKSCRVKKAPFLFDHDHYPIYVDDFCRQTGLKRGTWRHAIRVQRPDGVIVPALPMITPRVTLGRSAAHTADTADTAFAARFIDPVMALVMARDGRAQAEKLVSFVTEENRRVLKTAVMCLSRFVPRELVEQIIVKCV